MPKITHLCLPVQSDADIYYPDAFLINIKHLAALKPILETAAHLNETLSGFRHIEIDFNMGTWIDISEHDVFLVENPVADDLATNYNDDPDLAPLEGFSARTNGHSVEFCCYEADTGLYSWSDPIYLRGDLVIYGRLACNLLTGELTEVADEQ